MFGNTLYRPMHPINPSGNFQNSSLSKSAQNSVSTFVKKACEYIGNKCVNLFKFCESDFGVIIWGKWLQMIGIYQL